MITLINGHPQDLSGLIVPNGSISFQLNIDATVIAAPYGFVSANAEVVFQFDSSGNILPNSPAVAAQIYSNAELNPQNSVGLGTYYQVTFYSQSGARLNFSPMWWQFPQAANSTVDISNMTPISTVGGNVIFYPTDFTIGPPGPTTLGGVFSNVGMPNQFITAINTDGTVSFGAVSAGSIAAAGPDTGVQINSGGLFYADSTFTYNHATGVLGLIGGSLNMPFVGSGSLEITGSSGALAYTAQTNANFPISFYGSCNNLSFELFQITGAYTGGAGSGSDTATSLNVNMNSLASGGTYPLITSILAVLNMAASEGGTATDAAAIVAKVNTGGANAQTNSYGLLVTFLGTVDPTTSYGVRVTPSTSSEPLTWSFYADNAPAYFGDSISVLETATATDVAHTGVIRLQNNEFINWRNSADSADLSIGYNSSNQFVASSILTTSLLSSGTIVYYGINQSSINTYAISSVANAVGATTLYTGTFSNSGGLVTAGGIVQITGFVNGANNGYFYVVSTNGGLNPTQVTVNNSAGVAEVHSGSMNTWDGYANGVGGAIISYGLGLNTITFDGTSHNISAAVVPNSATVGLVLYRGNDPLDATVLDTFLTDQNNRGFRIAAITDGVGASNLSFKIGVLSGVLGASLNCQLALGTAGVIHNSAKVSMTSTQLKALPGTTFNLVAAQGANKVIVVNSVTIQYQHVTTVYTLGNADNVMNWIYTGTSITQSGTIPAAGLFDQTSNAVASQASAATKSSPAPLQASIANVGVDLTITGTSPGLTLGDGTAVIWVDYSVIDVS